MWAGAGWWQGAVGSACAPIHAEGQVGRYSVRMTETAIHCPSCGHHLFDADLSAILRAPATSREVGGLPPETAEAVKALEAFFEGQQQFVRVEGGRVRKGDVIDAVNAWRAGAGLSLLSGASLGRGMTALGVRSSKSNGHRFYLGVARVS